MFILRMGMCPVDKNVEVYGIHFQLRVVLLLPAPLPNPSVFASAVSLSYSSKIRYVCDLL